MKLENARRPLARVRPFIAILLALTLSACASLYLVKSGVESGIDYSKNTHSGTKLDCFQDIVINGYRERVLIQSDDIQSKPILLFLHGGPGSSEMLWSHVYAEKLRQNFIFVNWDQRGAGYSYRNDLNPKTVSEAQIYEDALALVRYLTKTFKRNKVFLVGHSFGSAIGLQLAADHPELFYAYVGVGQIIDYDRSVAITYKWLHETLEKAKDTEGLARIEKDHFPSIDLVTKYGGHHRLSVNLDEIMKGSPYYSDGYLDQLRQGKAFSAENIGKNAQLRTVSQNSIYEILIPLYFFEGANDHVLACAPELVVEFCAKAKAPIKKIVWFENSAHLMNVEEPQKFQDELLRIMQETRL